MSTPDLTRWNRAGLSRFRYVDGNAVTHLEALRARLAEEFPGWEALAAPAAELYAAPRGDAGVELLRALARATHVLTEHLDAYANEGFLPTATQWESLRRLVAMIGYEPAPPASATTPLALEAHPGAAGRVPAGLPVRHAPPGGTPLTFETLEDLDVDAALNALRPEGHDRNPATLGGPRLELEGKVRGLRTGDPVILEDERSGALEAHVLTGVQEGDDATVVTLAAPPAGGLRAGFTRVHAAPADRLAIEGPAQGGTTFLGETVHLRDIPVDIAPGDVVALRDGTNAHLRRVRTVRDDRLVLTGAAGPLDPTRATAIRAETVPIAEIVTGRELVTPPGALLVVRVPGDRTDLHGAPAALPIAGGLVELTVFKVDFMLSRPAAEPEALRGPTTTLALSARGTPPSSIPRNPQGLLVAPPVPGPYRLDPVLLPGRRVEVARPKKAVAGDLVALVRGHAVAWGRVAVVESDPPALVLEAEPVRRGGTFLLARTLACTHFAATARVVGWNVNRASVGRRVRLAEVPRSLVRGRKVIAWRREVPGSARLTRIAAVEPGAVVLADAPPAGSTVGDLELAGNVVTAGHGESTPERVLGSGDATRAHQRFTLTAVDVAFVPDPAFPAGVRASLDVVVDGRRFTQVPTLADSRPEDHHYEVRLDEDGRAVVGFGDGRRGRRLPTGIDNVRVRAREGSGLAGLLPAGRLDAQLRGHALLAAVRQLLPSEGGNDREEVDSLREHAPGALLTLERAVSIADYARLAGRHSRVWQATAAPRAAGREREEVVAVHVVPAGGGDPGPELVADLEEHLRRHAPEGIRVEVRGPIRLALWCGATVSVDVVAFDPDAVARAVRDALLSALTLPRRRLGEPLSRSDVLRVLESIPGVASSRCEIGIARPDGGEPADKPPRLRAKPSELIAIAPGAPSPEIAVERAQT